MRRDYALLALAVLALVGCQTITEELPTRPTPQFVTVPIPVVVTPVANPAPAPAPAPAPGPAPAPVPNPPEPPLGTGQVVKIGLKVYFIEDQGQQVPGSEGATSAPVGSRVHLDATPKAADNRPTQPKGQPTWTYSNPSLVNVSGKNPYGPVLLVKARGTLSISVEVDGVQSNTLTLTLY